MVKDPALLAILKSISDYLVYILIFLGAVGGALKSSATNDDRVNGNKILNIFISIFCGATIASHYSNTVSPFLAGILSLVVSSVSIVILEDVILLAPKIFDWWIAKKFEMDKGEIEDFKARCQQTKQRTRGRKVSAKED